MSNPNKARGTRWERAVRLYLEELGLPVRRNAQHGPKDIGDLWVPGFSLECKDTARLELASFVDQATAQALNAGEPFGIAVVKRRGKGPAYAYAVTDLETMGRLMAEVLRLRETVERLSLLVNSDDLLGGHSLGHETV